MEKIFEVLVWFSVGYAMRGCVHIYAKQLKKFKRRCKEEAEKMAAAHYAQRKKQFYSYCRNK